MWTQELKSRRPITPLAPARNMRLGMLILVQCRQTGFVELDDEDCQQRSGPRITRIFADAMMGPRRFRPAFTCAEDLDRPIVDLAAECAR